MTSAQTAVKRLKGESLQQKSLTQLKEDATDLGLSKDDVKAYGNLSYKQTWVDAINDYMGKLFDEPTPEVETSFDPEPISAFDINDQVYELEQQEEIESTVQPIQERQRYEVEEVEDGNGNTIWFVYDHVANNWLDASTDDYIGYKTLEKANERATKVNCFSHKFCIGDRVRLLEIPKKGIFWNPDYLAGTFEVAEDHFNGLLSLNWLDETGRQIRQISVGYDYIEHVVPSISTDDEAMACDRIESKPESQPQRFNTLITRFISKAIHYPTREIYRVWDTLNNAWDIKAYDTPDDAQKRVNELTQSSGMLAA